ncbi:polyketide synthase [Thiohalobacter thiocyanaticus]|uniref:Polyketide synthase n=1 Tax=Thiohalobacter thiocyanaticus TaxID=585455 RepID=A0A1Z4VNV6_9GAMM|nr:hypothetical protein [Thiohalobacter thiocyanaticus]BAZ93028.1 polyketide synthase [Thiohalobacter thiocyanaticus]
MEHDERDGEVPANYQDEAVTLSKLIDALHSVSPDARERLIKTLVTFFDIQFSIPSSSKSFIGSDTVKSQNEGSPSFSEDRSMSPKEFLLEKQPRTDVERVACLAYYLTHYRDTPHFKTIDISKLNTEAAQRKFANAAKAVGNAVRSEYLVPSTKGQRQLGAVGEVFVQALPNREEAKSAVTQLRPKRKRLSKKTKSNNKGAE